MNADVQLRRLRSLWALAAIALVAVVAAPAAPAQTAADPPAGAVISPDGKRAVWASEDAKSVWRARRTAAGRPPRWGPQERLLAIRGTVGDIAFSPDSDSI